jgi:hypothetical protein
MNKDIKHTFSDGTIRYTYSEDGTVQEKFPSGLNVFTFANG